MLALHVSAGVLILSVEMSRLGPALSSARQPMIYTLNVNELVMEGQRCTVFDLGSGAAQANTPILRTVRRRSEARLTATAAHDQHCTDSSAAAPPCDPATCSPSVQRQSLILLYSLHNPRHQSLRDNLLRIWLRRAYHIKNIPVVPLIPIPRRLSFKPMTVPCPHTHAANSAKTVAATSLTPMQE